MRAMLLGLIMTIWMSAAWAITPQRVMLHVENMTCPACSITIEKALDKVPGVTSTQVDTRAGTVTVIFDAKIVDSARIAKAITDAGFPATIKTGSESG
ncbi:MULTISPECIES: heavy-metal-associated domain-containing protein [Lysobacteraceae]|jgi:mercuric ion binding protein|uniref:Mercuric ion binding protein n=3 Tax=Lysobacteraceae TaxID=32033 RepID=A0AB73H3E8_9XANT|nr:MULTISPECIES: heavy-metal-associated domain-containing protein [Xanthomonadaceae]MBN5158028.1 heavy-metal-associated domain-containing protein [Stenotrophomonas maltophilia]PZQ28499.1 MAG: copper chaperone [Stenotrophomonas acidaminiphila]KAF1724975.1 copper chaperone [Pseudoxanthomonas japonensis]KAF1728106.1 copper chaperone [Pseudoxanthomonas mexicana]KLB41239.1 heavy metal transporter [Xanthomonas euvesicatoria]